jgi:hypothetical protein
MLQKIKQYSNENGEKTKNLQSILYNITTRERVENICTRKAEKGKIKAKQEQIRMKENRKNE